MYGMYVTGCDISSSMLAAAIIQHLSIKEQTHPEIKRQDEVPSSNLHPPCHHSNLSKATDRRQCHISQT